MQVTSMRKLILAAALCTALPALRADVRTALGANVTKAVETAVRSAVPDGTLTWEDRIVVTREDGARSTVVVAGLAEITMPQGPFVVVQVEFVEFAEAEAERLATFSTEPATQPTDVLAAVRFSAAGEVQQSKINRLDPTSAAIETKDLAAVETEGSWPSVEVTYWARYGTPDFHGSVRWYGVYDFDLMEHYSRMPLGITKFTKAGGEVSEQISAVRMDDAIVNVAGGMTGHLLGYPCPFPCLFDGKALLAGWTSSMPPVPAETVTE